MRFKSEEVVRGVSAMSFVADNGEKVESGAVFVDVALDEGQGGKGFRTDMLRCASLELAKGIVHNAFPMKAELDIEHRASRKATQLVVVGIKPLESAGLGPVKRAA